MPKLCKGTSFPKLALQVSQIDISEINMSWEQTPLVKNLANFFMRVANTTFTASVICNIVTRSQIAEQYIRKRAKDHVVHFKYVKATFHEMACHK